MFCGEILCFGWQLREAFSLETFITLSAPSGRDIQRADLRCAEGSRRKQTRPSALWKFERDGQPVAPQTPDLIRQID